MSAMNSNQFLVPAIKEAVLRSFRDRFVPEAEVIWDGSPRVRIREQAHVRLNEIGIGAFEVDDLPTVILRDGLQNLIVCVDVVAERGAISTFRSSFLRELFQPTCAAISLVSAFHSRRDLHSLDAMVAWETFAWFANEPEHLVLFGGSDVRILKNGSLAS
jgi:type II restriction enzyme